jgi:hypothetical protein
LKIKNLGMGVCNVTKAPLTVRETLMIKWKNLLTAHKKPANF